MSAEKALADLSASLDQAVDLLDEFAPHLADDSSLPSLLAQCEAACAAPRQPEPIRTLHHLACTGGTMIARCLAAMPNVLMLSEMDPLSRHHVTAKTKPFNPTDLILDLRYGPRKVPDAVFAEMFLASLRTLHSHAESVGQRIVLRDHAHSQFCTMIDPISRPTTRSVIGRGFILRSAVTVRHPLDSFLSLHANKWAHFRPFTLDEYAQRYMLFLDAHHDVPMFRYEDIVAEPAPLLQRLCNALDLAFVPEAIEMIGAIVLSGDSGRKGDQIGKRDRRPVPLEIAKAAAQSESYAQLCHRCGYASEP